MVRLFGRPSRSYASTASAYLDPSSVYPTLAPETETDTPTPTGLEVDTYDNGWDRGGRLARQREGAVVDSSGTGETSTKNKKTRSKNKNKVVKVQANSSTMDMDELTDVRIDDDERPPRAGPSSLFNGAHAASRTCTTRSRASAVQPTKPIKPILKPSTATTTHTATTTKRNRQSSNPPSTTSSSTPSRTFSAIDLAPPPPSRSTQNRTLTTQVDSHAVKLATGLAGVGYADTSSTTDTTDTTSMDGAPPSRSRSHVPNGSHGSTASHSSEPSQSRSRSGSSSFRSLSPCSPSGSAAFAASTAKETDQVIPSNGLAARGVDPDDGDDDDVDEFYDVEDVDEVVEGAPGLGTETATLPMIGAIGTTNGIDTPSRSSVSGGPMDSTPPAGTVDERRGGLGDSGGDTDGQERGHGHARPGTSHGSLGKSTTQQRSGSSLGLSKPPNGHLEAPEGQAQASARVWLVDAATLAPPQVSIQPPTPMRDVDSTPFHIDVTDSTGTRAAHAVEGRVMLGSPIGVREHNDTRPPITPSGSAPNSQPGSSDHSRQSSAESIRRNGGGPGLRPRTTNATRVSSRASDGSGHGVAIRRSPSASVKSGSRPVSPSVAWRGPIQPPISVPFLPPADPSQPSYLRWDPSAQRWVPAAGPPPAPSASAAHWSEPPGPSSSSSRPHSIVSSAESVYSQASAPAMAPMSLAAPPPPPTASARRASLPQLSTSWTPLPASSRPFFFSSSSDAHSRPGSPSGSKSPVSGSPSIGSGLASRRMSIEPAYSLGPATLTLLPEMLEQPSVDPAPQAASRPPSRSTSIVDGAARWSASSVSHYRKRNSAAFPSGYDVDARAWAMAAAASSSIPRSRPQSDAGDAISDAGGSRPPSLHGGSQVAGRADRPPSRAARESALDTMSSRGDPVPLLGADGTGGEGLGGYTSLVLPTGAYKPVADPTRNLDRIDPRVLGMPSTSMSTITVNRTAAHARRRSSFAAMVPSRHESPTPAHLLADQPAPVSFSSHQAPPSKILPAQVLVQVYTVALDRTDADIVREKAAAGSGAGKWVPGRSFCGRALDVGPDVRTILKGDMVMGLVDVKKSGSLAEFITCDRRRIARIPFNTDLSLEQLASLPLLGVVAHRAASYIGMARGSRALILHAHEGVGALVCQELSMRGVNVVAHAPEGVYGAEEDCWDNGAREVIVDDDEVAVINEQHESEFQYVLDTVGGRRIYDAARRVLRTTGCFVTLYGDDGDRTSVPHSPVKSSFHSLRRAFVRKGKKAISYIHLSPGACGTVVGGGDVDPSGLDSRDVLESDVMKLFRPKVGVVVPFERAGDALELVERRRLKMGVGGRRSWEEEEEGEDVCGESGTVVVRLIN